MVLYVSGSDGLCVPYGVVLITTKDPSKQKDKFTVITECSFP